MCLITDDINIEHINSWADVLGAYTFLSLSTGSRNREWAFRGERSTTFRLATTFERAATISGHELDFRPKLEQQLIREFKRRLHHYTADVPEKNDTLEWLALMQHYGAPTRLLDWTYSFFVAIYFAIEDARDDKCVVHALKVDEFDGLKVLSKIDRIKIHRRLRQYWKDDSSLKGEHLLKRRALVDYLLEHPRPLIHPVNAFRLNQRLTIQQGLFMFPGDISKSFDDNLAAHKAPRGSFIRFEISSETQVRADILSNLSRMNVGRATLFPGLQGFSESLKTLVAILPGNDDE